MWRRMNRAVYRVTFWLPFIEREMAMLADDGQRDAARWYVWRKLFRSFGYWLIVAIVMFTTPVFMWALHPLLTSAAGRFLGGRSYVGFLVYLLGVTSWALVTAVGGMWPIRRLIQMHMRQFLRDLGIPICAGCGYDLRAHSEGRCPECGTEIKMPQMAEPATAAPG